MEREFKEINMLIGDLIKTVKVHDNIILFYKKFDIHDCNNRVIDKLLGDEIGILIEVKENTSSIYWRNEAKILINGQVGIVSLAEIERLTD